MKEDNELLRNLDKLHTTELGVERIKRNLSLDTSDVDSSYWNIVCGFFIILGAFVFCLGVKLLKQSRTQI